MEKTRKLIIAGNWKMNKTVAEFQSLLAAIKSDPKKYLNVRVSIF